ncbi:MAG: hypothetical protein K5640_01065 [Treponema sp.]|nr:hypothetical protein [Treponema sp.]
MNFALYSDSEKNLFMFFPEGTSDEQLVTIGEKLKPSRKAIEQSDFKKALGTIDYKRRHATYPIYNSFTDLDYFSFSEITQIFDDDDFTDK